MAHQKVFVSTAFPNHIHYPQTFIKYAWVIVDEYGIVLITFCCMDVEIRYIFAMQLALLLLHLIPLGVGAMRGVNLPKSFHRQEEHQLEMWHTTMDGFSVKSSCKSLARGKWLFGHVCPYNAGV
jgi:hypothetical protein